MSAELHSLSLAHCHGLAVVHRKHPSADKFVTLLLHLNEADAVWLWCVWLHAPVVHLPVCVI